MRSIIELVPTLLRIPSVDFIMTDKLNQDPLEEHLGKHRSKLGGADNPTVENYQYTERKLILAKGHAIQSLCGNTRGRIRKQELDLGETVPLKKRLKTVRK